MFAHDDLGGRGAFDHGAQHERTGCDDVDASGMDDGDGCTTAVIEVCEPVDDGLDLFAGHSRAVDARRVVLGETEREFRELVDAAGLVFDGCVPTPTPLSFVTAHVR